MIAIASDVSAPSDRGLCAVCAIAIASDVNIRQSSCLDGRGVACVYTEINAIRHRSMCYRAQLETHLLPTDDQKIVTNLRCFIPVKNMQYVS